MTTFCRSFAALGLLAILASLACFTSSAAAFDYNRTPLAMALPKHPVVVVAKITERDGDNVVALPVKLIKGRKRMSYTLPAVWRKGTEFTFGPIPLEVGKTYFLMLQLDEAGRPMLSKDYACDAVVQVASADAPAVRTAAVWNDLSQLKDAQDRKRRLAQAWEGENDKTRLQLLQQFLHQRDEATVPFLLQAMDAGAERGSLMEYSALVIQRHSYKSAIPGLLKIVDKHDWASLYPATTLGKLKAKKAYEPIMALINKNKTGDRQYMVQALCYLEDPRCAPFMIETLHEYREKNWHMNYSWVPALQSLMEIPNRDLQLAAVDALQRIEWFRGNAALAKVIELRRQHAEDAEFRRTADTTIKHIDR